MVTDVYGADQDPIPGVTGKLVVDGVAEAAPGQRVVYLPHRQDVLSFLDEEVRAGDLVVTMGCGDIWMLGDAALERIREGAMNPALTRRTDLACVLRGSRSDGVPARAADVVPAGGTCGDLCRTGHGPGAVGGGEAIVATRQIPFVVIGKGSNILVSDAGFAGLVVRLGRGFRWVARDGDRLTAGAAIPLPALAGVALRHGLAGLEFGVAIPATLGGAVG